MKIWFRYDIVLFRAQLKTDQFPFYPHIILTMAIVIYLL